MSDFNACDLAKTAWAFAKADQLHAQLFMALARVAEWQMDGVNTQDLANTT